MHVRIRFRGESQLGFDVFLPRNENDALSFIAKTKKKILLLGGGTDLLRETEKIEGQCLVDISHLENLRHITREDDVEKVGALTRISDFNHSAVDNYEAFNQLAKGFGGRAISNMATVGGNICAASPAADLLPILLALDAVIVTRSLRQERSTGILSFLLAPGKTGLRKDEIIAEVQFEAPARGKFCTFRKIGRRGSVFRATVSLSVFVHLNEVMEIKQARIAFNSLRDNLPRRANLIEQNLRGKRLESGAIQEVVSSLSKEYTVPSDINASSEYKLDAAEGLLEDQLCHIENLARGL